MAVPSRLSPPASRLAPASGSLISIESLVGSEGQHTQKNACLRLSSEFTFPLVAGGHRRATNQLRNCETGALDRSHWAICSAQIWTVFGDAKRGIVRGSLRELRSKSGRNLHLPASRPCAEKNPIKLVYDHSFPQAKTAQNLHKTRVRLPMILSNVLRFLEFANHSLNATSTRSAMERIRFGVAR